MLPIIPSFPTVALSLSGRQCPAHPFSRVSPLKPERTYSTPDMGRPAPSKPSAVASSVYLPRTPAIKNAPPVSLIDGSGDFSNRHLAALVLFVPLVVQQSLKSFVDLPRPLTGVSGYAISLALLGVPVTISYWTYKSRYGRRHNDKIPIPEGNIEKFIEVKDESLRKKYHGQNKIPMVAFHDAYIAGEVDFNG